MKDEQIMRVALEQALLAQEAGEVPIGAAAVFDGRIIARAHNSPKTAIDPTAHAEMLTLRAAAAELEVYRLEGLELFVTLEPCLMCFGAMLHARIPRLVFGAHDPKVGFSRIYNQHLQEAQFNHKIEIVGGVLESECAAILQGFFKERR
jgi:tRNA(adenine34) deaminase